MRGRDPFALVLAASVFPLVIIADFLDGCPMRPHVFYRFGCWHVFRPGLQTYRRLTAGGITVLGEHLHGDRDDREGVA